MPDKYGYEEQSLKYDNIGDDKYTKNRILKRQFGHIKADAFTP